MSRKTKVMTETIIKHFKRADRYNQLRPGETHLAIESFFEGFQAAMSLVESLKLTQDELTLVMNQVGEYFDQFEDSKHFRKNVA